MNALHRAKVLAGATIALALLGGAGAWRYYRVPVELRQPSFEAWWHLVPFIGLLVLAAALLVLITETTKPEQKRHDKT